MISRGQTLPLVAFAVVCAVAASSRAQEADESADTEEVQVDPASDAEARTRYEAGVMAYDSGRYDDALSDFRRAYELSPRPALLYNIATAADRARRDEAALDAYREYLAAVPDSGHRARVEARIEAIERTLPEEQEPGGRELGDVPEPSPSRVGPIVVLALGGAALAGAVVTAVLWVDREDIASQCELRGCENADVIARQRNTAAGLTVTLGVVGVAGVTAGLVWLLKSGSAEDDASASFRCSPTLGGALCAGTF